MKKGLLVIMLFIFSHYANSQIHVGSWVSDISPKESEFNGTCLGGYGNPYSRCNSIEILDSISVRALSLRDTGTDTEILMVVIDTVGVGDNLALEIKQKISDWSGGKIKKDAIRLTATHTHSAPDMQGLWGGISPDYRERVITKAAMTGLLARTFSFKAKIFASQTTAKVENRRGWEEVDNSVNVLLFKSKRYGHTIASLVNMSAHPTILDETNFAYSAGYVNSLRKEVEKKIKGVSIFVNGIVGDAQPTVSARTYEASQSFGSEVANSVVESLKDKERVKGELVEQTVEFNHALTNQNVLLAQSLGLLDLNVNDDNTIDTQFRHFSIGKKVSGLGFPGEALTRLGIPLKNKLHSPYKFFFGLYGNSYGYFIPSDEYLQIPDRTTEENASIDINIGDHAKAVIENMIE